MYQVEDDLLTCCRDDNSIVTSVGPAVSLDHTVDGTSTDQL